jgi:hypothetical protein
MDPDRKHFRSRKSAGVINFNPALDPIAEKDPIFSCSDLVQLKISSMFKMFKGGNWIHIHSEWSDQQNHFGSTALLSHQQDLALLPGYSNSQRLDNDAMSGGKKVSLQCLQNF